MTKKVFYNLGLALIDFVVIFLICILAMFIITRDSEYLDKNFVISTLIISFVKVGISYLCKTYNMLWMYSIRRNLTKLVIITLLVDIFFIILSLIPAVGEYTKVRTTIYIVVMLFGIFCQ